MSRKELRHARKQEQAGIAFSIAVAITACVVIVIFVSVVGRG